MIERVKLRGLPWRRMFATMAAGSCASLLGSALSAVLLAQLLPWCHATPGTFAFDGLGEAWSFAWPTGITWLALFHLPLLAWVRSGWVSLGLGVVWVGGAALLLFLLASSSTDLVPMRAGSLPLSASLAIAFAHIVVGAGFVWWWDRRRGDYSPIGRVSTPAQLVFLVILLVLDGAMLGFARGVLVVAPIRSIDVSMVEVIAMGIGVAVASLIFVLPAFAGMLIRHRRSGDSLAAWSTVDLLLAVAITFLAQLILHGAAMSCSSPADDSGTTLMELLSAGPWFSLRILLCCFVALAHLAIATNAWADDSDEEEAE